MEKKVQIGMLCDIYGKLLTKRQYNILNDYANGDLSLTEIAENNNIKVYMPTVQKDSVGIFFMWIFVCLYKYWGLHFLHVKITKYNFATGCN